MKKVEPTGYWTFFCNPKVWSIDKFLQADETDDYFTITEWQKGWFKPGQLGALSGLVMIGVLKANWMATNVLNEVFMRLF